MTTDMKERDLWKAEVTQFPLVATWNSFAENYNLPTVLKVTESRKRALKKCDMDVKEFTIVLGRMAMSSFLMGRTPRSGPHANWRVSFDWAIKEDNYINVLEGKYDDGPKQKEKPDGYSIP